MSGVSRPEVFDRDDDRGGRGVPERLPEGPVEGARHHAEVADEEMGGGREEEDRRGEAESARSVAPAADLPPADRLSTPFSLLLLVPAAVLAAVFTLSIPREGPRAIVLMVPVRELTAVAVLEAPGFSLVYGGSLGEELG